MAEEEYTLIPYKDISELKKQLEGVQDKKDISTKDLYEAVHRLTTTMNDMLEVFGSAAEQMKLEEKEYEAESKKHDMIMAKLDKLIEQNRAIAEGMVAIVELVKEKFGNGRSAEKSETRQIPDEPAPSFTPAPMPKPVPRPQAKPQFPPQNPGPMMPPQQNPFQTPQMQPAPAADLPPMQPAPMPDLDFPDEPFPSLDELGEPKKKGLFGVFKK